MEVRKDWTFDMAHRLVRGYKGKCAHLHGHTYRCEVVLLSEEPDVFGMVINFDKVKELLKGWVDTYMDHATIVVPEDKALLAFLRKYKQKHYVFRYPNSTAELIALHLRRVFVKILDGDPAVYVSSVAVWETPTSAARCSDSSWGKGRA